MKSILLSLALSACALPAHGLEVQLTENKSISLTYFPQSEGINENVEAKTEKDYSKGIKDFAGLGMSNAPVLDQGQYGTCVTFASTGALNALFAQGDFVSQQCSLELFKFLGNDIWNGAYRPSEVVDPLKQYGVVTKSGCPRSYGNPYWSTSKDEYAKIVDSWASAEVKSVNLVYLSKASLPAVKKAIDAGHRVMFGFLLNGSSSEAVRGFDVVVGGKKYQGGLWACKQGISANHCVNSNAGHEVIIVGYDDAEQLLKIRNSWNVEVGYRGEYYMSYKFFETMAIDQTEIW